MPAAEADRIATSVGSSGGGGAPPGTSARLIDDVELAFAHSVQTVFYVMAAVLAATFLFALVALPAGRVEESEPVEEPAPLPAT